MSCTLTTANKAKSPNKLLSPAGSPQSTAGEKSMTVVIAVIGLALATAYLYQAWEDPNPGPNNFYRMNSPTR